MVERPAAYLLSRSSGCIRSQNWMSKWKYRLHCRTSRSHSGGSIRSHSDGSIRSDVPATVPLGCVQVQVQVQVGFVVEVPPTEPVVCLQQGLQHRC